MLSPSKRFLSTSLAKKIGFIGLGNMGASMAANLIKHGAHKVVVFDINEQSVSRLKELGAEPASSPADVASRSCTVVTMLPSSPHVLEVFTGRDGMLAKATPGSLFIDCSTIDPKVAQQVGAECTKLGHVFCDAPVSGGTAGAAAGTLTFMCGAGDPENMSRVERELVPMAGKKAFLCGPVGTGQVAKLCNNLVLAVSMAGLAEAMQLGRGLGMDPKTLLGVINASSGRCWSSEIYCPSPGVVEGVPSSRGYSGGFATDLMIKDLSLAAAAAREARAPLPLGATAQQLYTILSAQGKGQLDFSAIYKLLERTP